MRRVGDVFVPFSGGMPDTVGQSEGDHWDDDAVEEDVCEDCYADCTDDENRGRSIFEEDRSILGIFFSP